MPCLYIYVPLFACIIFLYSTFFFLSVFLPRCRSRVFFPSFTSMLEKKKLQENVCFPCQVFFSSYCVLYSCILTKVLGAGRTGGTLRKALIYYFLILFSCTNFWLFFYFLFFFIIFLCPCCLRFMSIGQQTNRNTVRDPCWRGRPVLGHTVSIRPPMHLHIP